MHVVIVGCGIAGLASAIGVRKAGHEATILERAPVARESGGGLAISPNASCALKALGVLSQLLECADTPDHTIVRCYNNFDVCHTQVLGNPESGLYETPSFLVRRGDLHAALYAEAQQLGVKILLSHGVVELNTETPAAITESGAVFTADLIIAADGERSVCRNQILGQHIEPRDSGHHLFLTAFPIPIIRSHTSLTKLVEPPSVNMVIGPGGHAVTYTLERDNLLYVLLITKHEGTEELLPVPQKVNVREFRDSFREWDVIYELLGMAQDCIQWTLLDADMPQTWIKGKTILVGDAAHAMLPFLGQGAAMALEDAVVLSNLLSRIPTTQTSQANDIQKALDAFFQLRYPRTQSIKDKSRELGEIYALSQPDLKEEIAQSSLNGDTRQKTNNLADTIRERAGRTPWADEKLRDFLFLYDPVKIVQDYME